MLSKLFFLLAITLSVNSYADCEISNAIKNKSCSNDYFTVKNSKQLNEYLQYGKFKDG